MLPSCPSLWPAMLDRFKTFWQGVMLAPFVDLFLRLGVSPDMVLQ